jgi:hypothetical protein
MTNFYSSFGVVPAGDLFVLSYYVWKVDLLAVVV